MIKNLNSDFLSLVSFIPKNYIKISVQNKVDKLIFTKPIGIGILTTSIKRDLLYDERIKRVVTEMTTLNKYAVTDITRFGLLGHAYEMASGSDVSFVIQSDKVPQLPGTRELAEQKIIPAGSRANHRWFTDVIHYENHISPTNQIILCDVVTSGGLLISLPDHEATQYVKQFAKDHSLQATIIGKVIEKQEKSIYVK